MNILRKMTSLTYFALGLSFLAPQRAEAQWNWRKREVRTQNVVERLVALEQYSTLVTAVTEAGLVDALAGLDQATIFAPTNAAFAKIPAESLSALLADKAAFVGAKIVA